MYFNNGVLKFLWNQIIGWEHTYFLQENFRILKFRAKKSLEIDHRVLQRP